MLLVHLVSQQTIIIIRITVSEIQLKLLLRNLHSIQLILDVFISYQQINRACDYFSGHFILVDILLDNRH